jgi:hypothetical protein
MLGRKTFTQQELDDATAAIAEQLAAYKALAGAASSDPQARSALDAFAPLFFNHLALALDRRFVHRLRGVTGKAGTPLNELELIVESLLNHHGVLHGITVIKYVPEESVVKLGVGDEIHLSEDQFERLSQAVLAELEAKFVA